MRIRKWTSSHPTNIVTDRRRAEEAEREAAEWKARYQQQVAEADRCHRLWMEAEERLFVYEQRDQRAECEAKERAASPVHHNTMIGRGSAEGTR